MLATRDLLVPISSEYLPATKDGTAVEQDLLKARISFVYFVTVQLPGSLEKGRVLLEKAKAEIADLHGLSERNERLSWLQPEIDQVAESVAVYEAALKQLTEAIGEGRNHGPEYAPLVERWTKAGWAMSEAGSELAKSGHDLTENAALESAANLRKGILAVAGCCGLVLLLGAVLGFWTSRSIRRVLRGISSEVTAGADAVALASAGIASASQALAHGASQQAASLEETSASAEEITAMTRLNADGAQGVVKLMGESQAIGTEVGRAVENMRLSIGGIDSSTLEVSKIIKTVEEIAFQTNILALNAAVEAARAGESGLGFAVVAEEVRRLAQRCSEAATRTTQLIENSLANARDGKVRLESLTKVFGRSLEIQNAVKEQAEQISVSSNEQARGVDEIRKAVQMMSNLTQETAAHSEQSAAAGQELAGQAKDFNGITSRLRGLVG